MACITSTYIPLAKASSQSCPSLGNKEVTYTIYPKNRVEGEYQYTALITTTTLLLLFFYTSKPYAYLCQPALRHQHAHIWGSTDYSRFPWKRWQIDIRQNFLFLCPVINRAFIRSFSGLFRIRTQAYINPCLQEYVSWMWAKCMDLFHVGTYYSAKSRNLGKWQRMQVRLHSKSLCYTNKKQNLLFF